MKFVHWLILALLLTVALPALGGGFCHAAEKPVLIDVRTEAEWKEGHLEGALLIPHDKIGAAIATAVPDKSTPVNLYCRTGRRSAIALDTLKGLGYGAVTNYGSLTDAAEKLKLPVVK